ncbi:hypothetical protein AB0M87_02555 [Streptomyces sp. NPDC051320]|uniref:hypothetical protein n=1 Tax=Streptomyces sp. NPDC051320 TaxID=3154644 RepID=UPI0034422386
MNDLTDTSRQCGLCEHDANGGHLCSTCSRKTGERLAELPGLYRELAEHLAPRSSGGHGRTAAAVYAPLPVAELPLNMRGPGGMVGITEDWLSAVHEERHLPAPTRTGSVEQRLRVAAAGLGSNMPWISISWPLAGAFAEEIRELHDAAAAVINPPERPDRGMRLGQCPAVTDADGLICRAVLRLFPGERIVWCRSCGCAYPPAMWPGLKVLIDHDAAEPSTAAGIWRVEGSELAI